MKIIIFLLSFVSIVSKLNAQNNFEYNFLGREYLHYKGVQFKLNVNEYFGLEYSFYSDIKECQLSYNKNVKYQDPNMVGATLKDSLVNKVYLVEKIIDYNGNELSDKTVNYSSTNPILVLKDLHNGEIIFYKYNKDISIEFPFLTSKIIYPNNFFCSKIEKEIDEFTNEIKFSTPTLSDGEISPVSILKIISKGKTIYYLSLRTQGSTININKTGVIILFQDGTKWSKDAKIEADAGRNGFDYSAFITLNPNDLAIFSSKKIKKFRLYIYDQEISPRNADLFKYYVDCIKTIK
jgi:hypothetical protein